MPWKISLITNLKFEIYVHTRSTFFSHSSLLLNYYNQIQYQTQKGKIEGINREIKPHISIKTEIKNIFVDIGSFMNSQT